MGIYKRKQESKKTRKHTFDQENDQKKKKDFRFKSINQFNFEPLKIIVVICRFDQIEYF